MSCINSGTVDFWQKLAYEVSKQRPYASRRVRVTGGRKHVGKSGTVLRHQRSAFSGDRYGSDANLHLRDLRGRLGFCCLVREDSGEQFWIRADYVECVDSQAEFGGVANEVAS